MSRQRSRRSFSRFSAVAAILATLSGLACAETYPTRPITMVVPYPAGGLFDVLARVLSEHMRTVLSQPVVIENIGGAGGSIAMGRVARAAPDGYTVAIGSEDHFVVNAAVYPVSYDVVTDFDPVTLLARGSALVIGRPELPAKDLAELTAWLQANQATVAFAHNGAGGLLHRCGLALQRATNANWPFIPYRGAAPALQDVLGGRVDVMCAAPASSLAMVRSGRIRAYGTTGATRLTSAPDIPTVAEAGFSSVQISGWGAVFMPKGSPKPAIARLNAALVDALASPSIRQKITELGLEIFPPEQQTPEALARMQKEEIARWWPIIKAANIKPE